jgi:hypothetical protein
VLTKNIKVFLFFVCVLIQGKSYAQLSSSNLPIFIINTGGKAIVNDPKILVDLKVIYGGPGKTNAVNSSTFNYNGKAGIELRGSSSQGFPKKPYSIELRDAAGMDNPQELCGLPKESDFILYASYNEKSMMNNVLSMALARSMGGYSSRTKYVELILNNEYQGVYILMEKIKVDKNRLDIADLTTADNSGDQLTGGYIMKIDKTTGTGSGGFRSSYANVYGKTTEWLYHAPKDINNTQKAYIRDYITKFEKAIYDGVASDTVNGYRKYVNVVSFVKMFILNEVSRNVDGYRISSYFYKDKDSKGGKLTAGPAWDYDIAYGNADYCRGSQFDLWGYKFNDICSSDTWQVPTFWDRMLRDNYFLELLQKNYKTYRTKGNLLDLEVLNKQIDAYVSELKEPQSRNFQKWNILGKYVWPNPQPVPANYEGEVKELKDWLANRLRWLDQNMPEPYYITANEPIQISQLSVYPNPFLDQIQLRLHAQVSQKALLEAFDISGKKVIMQNLELNSGENNIELKVPEDVNKLLIIKLKMANGQLLLQKAVKSN